MRISLWILNDWLRKYDPIPKITTGERVLRNARLFSDELKISRSTVYLDQIQSDRILCSSGHDFLLLHADDINAVFNDILDAFDYYNGWAEDLYDLIEGGCGAGELLRAGNRVFDRLVILADATFYMRELCWGETASPALAELGEALERRMLPLEILLELSSLPYVREPGRRTYVVEPAGIRPGAAVTNLFSGSQHRGWLVTVNETGVYGRGSRDLQDAFGEIVAAWMERNDRQSENMDRGGMFLELLEGAENAEQRAEERLKPFGWYPSDPKQLYAIRRIRPEADPMLAEARYLERLNPYAFLLRRGDWLLLIVDRQLTPPERYEEEMGRILSLCGSVAGRSPVFTELGGLPRQLEAAKIAAGLAPEEPGTLCPFEAVVLPYLAGLLRENSAVDPRHPALAVLRDYDRAHDGDLTKTLAAFLAHNCSAGETAAVLFIHRSTLLYRLQRIRELTDVDLEDYSTRLHLQLSFLVDTSTP